jgi:hypothetical protein
MSTGYVIIGRALTLVLNYPDTTQARIQGIGAFPGSWVIDGVTYSSTQTDFGTGLGNPYADINGTVLLPNHPAPWTLNEKLSLQSYWVAVYQGAAHSPILIKSVINDPTSWASFDHLTQTAPSGTILLGVFNLAQAGPQQDTFDVWHYLQGSAWTDFRIKTPPPSPTPIPPPPPPAIGPPGAFVMTGLTAFCYQLPVSPVPPPAAAVLITWTASLNATSFSVLRDGNVVRSGLSTLTYTDSPVPTGNHSYHVIAYNSAGSADSSNSMAAYVPVDICNPIIIPPEPVAAPITTLRATSGFFPVVDVVGSLPPPPPPVSECTEVVILNKWEIPIIENDAVTGLGSGLMDGEHMMLTVVNATDFPIPDALRQPCS